MLPYNKNDLKYFYYKLAVLVAGAIALDLFDGALHDPCLSKALCLPEFRHLF
jgi:hypothetical protein